MEEESTCLGETTPVKLRKGCWIRCPIDFKECRARKIIKIHTEGTWDVQIHSDCYHNQLRSLYGRVLAITPPAAPMALNALHCTAVQMARSLGHCYPASLDTIVSYFPKQKQRTYDKAKNSLLERPLEAKDCTCVAFVKVEKKADASKDPRMIQYRSTRFNLLLGRFTRPMEKLLYSMRDENGNLLIAKGMNNRTKAAHLWELWNQVDDPVALSLDLTRWDLHCSVGLLEVMHKFYLTITPDEELQALLQHQLVNKGITNQGIRYQSTGGVMSGDMTTALGNCALLVIIVQTLYKVMKREMPGLQFRMIDDGDDFVVLVNKCYARIVETRMRDWFSEIGHVLKVENRVQEFHQIMFCQSKPLRHHGVVEMIPNPHKVLASAFTVVGKRDRYEYLAELWNMRAILHQGQPVLGPIFQNLSAKYPSSRKIKIGIEYEVEKDNRTSVTWRTVENESRTQYEEQWGWSVDEQLDVERWFSLVEMPAVSDGPNDQPPWTAQGWPAGHLS